MGTDSNIFSKISEEGDEETKELIVKLGEAILVPPEQETHKGTLYFLSNLDQNFPAIVRTFYCYEKCEGKSNETACRVIRDALSKILVHYYPLAGRLVVGKDQKLAVECTGQGAVFVEAEANYTLQEVIIDENRVPHPSIHGKLVYHFAGANDMLGTPPLMAQVTKFKCGGFVLGICVNHTILDGHGAMQFMNSWSKIARGLPLSIRPCLDRSMLRARNPPKIEFPHHEFNEIEYASKIDEPEIVFKSFIFSPDKIKQIKAKANDECGYAANHSLFVTLSAFVWRARTKALKLHPDHRIKLLLMVDGRSRLNPPLPEGYFGNSVVSAHILCSAREVIEKPLSDTMILVKEAIGMITDKYIRSTIDYLEVTRAKSSLAATVFISSWSRLSFNTTDFGWGVPVAYGRTSFPQKEAIIFLAHGADSKSVNVLAGLPAPTMDIFQQLMEI
ncbi:hypothetical protein LguiB_004206 [Lonicera macranthoides]